MVNDKLYGIILSNGIFAKNKEGSFLKRKNIFIGFFTILTLCFCSSAYAIVAPTIVIDDKILNFDVSPVIENGRTLVPLRSIFETLEASVEWNDDTKTVIAKRDDILIKLTIGQRQAYKNDDLIELDVPAKILNGRTLVPLRFISESLGAKVEWNDEIREIKIKSNILESEVKVHFIDIMDGEAIYIQAPNNYDILIDAGSSSDGPNVVDYLKKYNIDDIDMMIATHPHKDNIGGLSEVIKEFQVKNIIDSGKQSNSKYYDKYWKSIEEKNICYSEDEDQEIQIGHKITLKIIETGDDYSNYNNNSVVTLLQCGNIKFLFTGDMGIEAEKYLLDEKIDINADIIKISQRGRETANASRFLKTVNAKEAIIFGGEENKIAKDVSSTLNKIKANIYYTNKKGVIITAQEDSYQINYSPYSYSSKLKTKEVADDNEVDETFETATLISSETDVTVKQAQKWAEKRGANETFINLASLYWELSKERGINPAGAYCQAAKETGFGEFTGVLDESFCNPCGMKTSVGGGNYDAEAHQRFANWEEGVMAHLDHLGLYAGIKGYPKKNTPDTRHFPFLFNQAETFEQLGGKWAGSIEYGQSIVNDYLLDLRNTK